MPAPPKKKAKRQLVPRTHAGGTWTKAKYFAFIRSALRQAATRYPVKFQVKEANRRTVTGKRWRYEYQCVECTKWFKDKEVQVDHIEPAGSLKEYTDLPAFAERLFCEPDGLQVMCKPCHQTKTNAEREERKKK